MRAMNPGDDGGTTVTGYSSFPSIRPAGQKQQLVQDTCQPLEKPWNRQLLHGNNLHTSGKWGLVILIKPLDFSPRNMFSFKPPNDGLQVQGFKSKICMGY